MPNEPQNGHGELNSWKEIAAHLGVTIRTAQRWESEKGLPVRRLPGERARVLAKSAELDCWKETATELPRPGNGARPLRRYAGILAGVIVLGAAVLAVRNSPWWPLRDPTSFRWRERVLTVSDKDARELWTHEFPVLPSTTFYEARPPRDIVAFTDLDGNGGTETVFLYSPGDRSINASGIYCFSSSGKLRWRYTTPLTLVSRGEEFRPPFHIRGFRVVAAPHHPHQKYIVYSEAHHWSHPCHVALLDSNGRPAGEYLHSGHLEVVEALDLDGDGIEEVLLSGVDQERSQAVLVVLDLKKLLAAGPLTASGAINIPSGLTGVEKAVVYFPRTSLNRKFERFNYAYQMSLTDGRITVYVREYRMRHPHSFMIYALNRDLSVNSVTPSDTILNVYKEMNAFGQLREGLDRDEVQRLRSSVQILTPATSEVEASGGGP
ncbi:MAG: hypothetical protein JNN08_31775 [Bryobacterales bacterium]|nr:hypothetical protein [Bryobacterales bacterium]